MDLNAIFLSDDDVLKLVKIAANLYDDDVVFPIDVGAVLYRKTTIKKQTKTFIEWFIGCVIPATASEISLEKHPRVFTISGRAGQGKSTLMRHMYLAIKGQWKKDARTQPNFTMENDDTLEPFFEDFQDSTLYAQARTLPEDSSQFGADGSRKLIFVDGIDEASTEQLEFLAQLIQKRSNSVK